MELGKIQPVKSQAQAHPSKEDQIAEALESGLRVPWLGLRPDLMLHKGAPDEFDKTTYIIEDPLRGQHFEIGEPDAKFFLCLASEKDLKAAVDKLMKTTSFRPSIRDIISFVSMLQQNKLAILPEGADFSCGRGEPEPEPETETEPTEEERKKQRIIKMLSAFWLLIKVIFWLPTLPIRLLWKMAQMKRAMRGLGSNANQSKAKAKEGEEEEKTSGWKPNIRIMFFKIPILRPDNFLNTIYPWLSPLWSKPFLYIYGVLGLVGLIFTVQQIELFMNTANYLFTFKGSLIFMVCLFVLKMFHEFGHALAAKHCGIYVRRMGIYMMMLMPMLYTDVSEAWKLSSKKDRLLIGAVGVLVELYVGMLALFFWSVLPDGVLRSVMFYTSGAAIISTILVNISPFMRFDGYYVLADYLGMSNLRPRSMAILKHYYYKLLVGWTGPKPEENPRENLMAVFGLGCHLYFIAVLAGIQYMIYTSISEIAAIIASVTLFFVYFAVPLSESTVYPFKKENWEYWGPKRGMIARVVALLMLLSYLFIPTQNAEMIPAFFLYRDVVKLETSGRGRIVTEVPQLGAIVQKGDLLLRLEDDYLNQELEMSRHALAQTEESIRNLPSGGSHGGYRKWLAAERERLMASQDKLQEAISQLEIRSPFSGRITDVEKTFNKGSYVSKKSYVLTIADDRFSEVRAYVPEKLYLKLKDDEESISSLGVMVPDLEAGQITAKFREMLDFPAMEFPNNSLFAYAGGPIMSSSSAGSSAGGMGGGMPKRPRSGYSGTESPRTLQPKDPQYPIFFDVSRPPGYLRHGTPCFVRIKGEYGSIAGRFGREMWRILAKQRVI